MSDRIEEAKSIFRIAGFVETVGGDFVILSGSFSLGYAFIKTLLYLEQGDRREKIRVILAENIYAVDQRSQKMYSYVWDKLAEYYPKINKAIVMEEIDEFSFSVDTGTASL